MADRTNDASRYLNIRSASNASFSPNGRRVAFLSDLTGVFQVWSVDVGGSQPNQLTFAEEPVSMVAYGHTQPALVYGMDQGGNERQQLFLLQEQGGHSVPLTHNPNVIYRYPLWSHDDKWIAVSSNERSAAFFDVSVLDLTTGELRPVFVSNSTNVPLAWSPDDRFLVISSLTTNLDNDLYLVDLGSGAAVQLTPHEGEAKYSRAAWTADGRGLYVVTNAGREFLNLAYLEAASQRIDYLSTPDWDIEELALSHDGLSLAYTTNIDGYSTLTVRETATGSEYQPSGLPRGVISDLAWSPDGRLLALTFQGARHNQDVWLFDVPKGQMRQLTHSPRGGIARSTLVEPELVRIPSFDGLGIPAYFYLPGGTRRTGNVPVILHVHGGPESQERSGFNAVYQYFLQRGYAVLAPNVRGSTGYGKRYTHLDDVRLRMDAVADLKASVEWLGRSGYSNDRRIAVMGRSYGGFMVLAALTAYPDLWSAGVTIVGIANFITFLQNTGPWRRRLREAEYGSLEHDADFLHAVSPIHKVERVTAPVFVVHGANDPRVPISEAEQIVAALRSRNRDVEYLRLDDEGHSPARQDNRMALYVAIADFLDRYLK